MKFFHISDLHIGCKLYNRDLSEDQRAVFEQICGYCESERPNALVIAGDVYDRSVPSQEAVEIFDSFMATLSDRFPGMTILMISGNHDSPARLSVYQSILSHHGLYVAGRPPQEPGEALVRVTLTDGHGPVSFLLMPFVKPSMVRFSPAF